MTQLTRRYTLKTTLGLLGLALILLNTGCGGGDNSVTPTIDPTVGSPQRIGSLEHNLTTDKRTYAVGETIQLISTFKNVGTTLMTLKFSQPTLIPSISRNGTEIPVSPQGGTGDAYTVSLPPGRVYTDYYSWTNLYPTGVPISAGVYTVSGYPESITVDQQFYTSAQAQALFTTTPIQFTVQ